MKEKLSSPAERKGSLKWRQKAALEKIWCSFRLLDQFFLQKKVVRENSDRLLFQEDTNFVHIPHGARSLHAYTCCGRNGLEVLSPLCFSIGSQAPDGPRGLLIRKA